ncbi:MAG: SPOR domain-containing protein [Sphingobium sp.]
MKSALGLSVNGLAVVGLALLSFAMTNPVMAQGGAIVQPTPPALAVERLNQNLTRLARQPTDMEALIGAGVASYELGDAQAANGFFTRANLVNPRVGRVKLGLALVALSLKNPRDAAMYFDDAERLGEPATRYRKERALAYDLAGQQDKAQRDYVTALGSDPSNADLIRAYAVSLGISGRVTEAETQLRPLLVASDRAAWRDRTMILAMNGRSAEARKIAQSIMPKSLADGMEPYLARMASLDAGQKAAAAHYGQFPAEGLRLAVATTPTAPPPAARAETTSRRRASSSRNSRNAVVPTPAPSEDSGLVAAMPSGAAPAPAMVQPIPAARTAPAPRRASNDERDDWSAAEQRLAAQDRAAKAAAAERMATQIPVPVPAARTPAPVPTTPVRTAAIQPAAIQPATTQPRQMVQGPSLSEGVTPAPQPVQSAPIVQVVQPVPRPAETPAASAPPPLTPSPRSLAAIMAEIKVSDAERAASARAVDLEEVARLQAANRKNAAAERAKKDAAVKAKAEAAAKAKAEAEEKARLKANPSRTWVQIATGRDPAALAFDMRRLRKTYPMLADEDAFTVEWVATRRLVVGPFVSVTKAKELVTDLKKAGGDGFVWQSEAGEVAKALSQK